MGYEQGFTAAAYYRLFFIYIEPISALVGSYYAAGEPSYYLSLLSAKGVYKHLHLLEVPTLISLYQLSNLYMLFAFNEHFVLSSTSSLRTWRALLFCLLIADFGHLATMIPLAAEKGWAEVFVNFWEWNAMEWGGVGFVYAGALSRILFLLGLGVQPERETETGIKEE